MEPDLKELLHRRGEEMRLGPDLPPTTLRRARRRRGWSVAFASVTVVAVIAGTVVALQAFGTTSTRRIGQSPSPSQPAETTPSAPVTTDGYALPAIWPETNLADIKAEQAAVDAGRDAWRTDPAATAQHFVAAVLGWPADSAVGLISAGELPDGTVTAMVTSLHSDGGQVAHGLFLGIDMTLAQVVTLGSNGVWSVVDVDTNFSNGIDLSCGTHPLVPGQPATLCGTLSISAPVSLVRYAIFDGGGFDLESFDDAPNHGTMVVGLHDRFRTEIAGPVDANASLLALEAVDSRGVVVTAFAERLRPPGVAVSPTPPGPNASSGPAPTTGPGATTGPETTGQGTPKAIDRAIWPVVTPARLDDLGQQVANGKADYALQPDTAAREFAVRMLGWSGDRVTVEGMADGIVYRSVPDVQAIVQNAELGPSTALVVHLEPATARGRTVWLVVGAESELFRVLCPPANQPTLDTSTPLHVCGTVQRAGVAAFASATVEYVESELQPSEAQSYTKIQVAGDAFEGRLQLIAAYANSDVAFVVRLVGPDGMVFGMDARRLHVG